MASDVLTQVPRGHPYRKFAKRLQKFIDGTLEKHHPLPHGISPAWAHTDVESSNIIGLAAGVEGKPVSSHGDSPEQSHAAGVRGEDKSDGRDPHFARQAAEPSLSNRAPNSSATSVVFDDGYFIMRSEPADPRPAFLPGVVARPGWLRRYQERQKLLAQANLTHAAVTSGDVPDGQDVSTGGPADHDHGRAPAIGEDRALDPLTHSNGQEELASALAEQPAGEVAPPAEGTRSRAELRKILQQEAQARRGERPFEQEADLTEDSLVIITHSDDAQPPHFATTPAGKRSAAVVLQTPAGGVARVDFADLTAVTTPGSDVSPALEKEMVNLRKRAVVGQRARDKLRAGTPPLQFAAPKVPTVPSRGEANEATAAAPSVSAGQGVSQHSATQSESATDSEDESSAAVRHKEKQLKRTRGDDEGDAQQKQMKMVEIGPRQRRHIDGEAPRNFTPTSSANDALKTALLEEEQSSRQRRQAISATPVALLRSQEKRVYASRLQTNREPNGTSPSPGPSRPRPPASIPSSTSFSSSSRRVALPSRMPKWTSYADCARQWQRWTKEGRLPGTRSSASAPLLAGLRFLLVGRQWNNRDYAGWVQRITLLGGRVLPELPEAGSDDVNRESQGHPLMVISIGIPKPLNAAGCAAILGASTLGEVKRKLTQRESTTEVYFVTREWVEESISRGKVLDADDPRWKLA